MRNDIKLEESERRKREATSNMKTGEVIIELRVGKEFCKKYKHVEHLYQLFSNWHLKNT